MQSQKLAKILIRLQDSDEGDRNMTLFNFMQVIKKNNLNYLLPSIKKVLEKVQRDKTEKSIDKIISPFVLEKSTEEELRSKYNLENIKQVVDKKIIAGFKIYTKNKIVDASLDTILKKFNKTNS